jgi:hypothetical protein
MSVYKRKLRQSEAERHFIYVEKAHRDLFPNRHVQFNVMVGKNLFNVEIDSLWRIWANYLWNKLPSFGEGDIVEMEKNVDTSFKISVEPIRSVRKPK